MLASLLLENERDYFFNLLRDIENYNMNQDPLEIKKYLPSMVQDLVKKRRTEFMDTLHEVSIITGPIEERFFGFDGVKDIKESYIKFPFENLFFKTSPEIITKTYDTEFSLNPPLGSCLRYCAILGAEELVKLYYNREINNSRGPAENLAYNANEEFKKGNLESASDLIEKAMESSPEFQRPYVNKAFLLRHIGDLEGSVELAYNSLQKFSRNKLMWYELACSLEELGKKIEAYESIKTALVIDPQFQEAICFLSKLKE